MRPVPPPECDSARIRAVGERLRWRLPRLLLWHHRDLWVHRAVRRTTARRKVCPMPGKSYSEDAGPHELEGHRLLFRNVVLQTMNYQPSDDSREFRSA